MIFSQYYLNYEEKDGPKILFPALLVIYVIITAMYFLLAGDTIRGFVALITVTLWGIVAVGFIKFVPESGQRNK